MMDEQIYYAFKQGIQQYGIAELIEKNLNDLSPNNIERIRKFAKYIEVNYPTLKDSPHPKTKELWWLISKFLTK
jgi:hypothetical protein